MRATFGGKQRRIDLVSTSPHEKNDYNMLHIGERLLKRIGAWSSGCPGVPER